MKNSVINAAYEKLTSIISEVTNKYDFVILPFNQNNAVKSYSLHNEL